MISTRIRLVALDLDGTLVGPGLAISERVRAAIARAREKGAEITIVTGRMFAASKPFAQTLGITGPLVCYQGAAIFAAGSGAELRETPVRQEVTRDGARVGGSARRARSVLCRRQALHAASEPFFQALHRSSESRARAGSVADRGVLRAAVDQDRARRRSGTLPKSTWPRCSRCSAIARTSRAVTSDFVEVLSPDVNKGEALAFVAQRYGVTLAETMAIGDAWNDVPLIAAAGVGVAMGSGPPELLAKADAVVGDVAHDGVAEAIERFVLA